VAKPYILVCRQLGGIGDFLMLSAVFRGLKEKYPKHSLQLVTSAAYENGILVEIAKGNHYIDKIHQVDIRTTTRSTAIYQRTHDHSPLEETDLVKKAARFIDLNSACIEYEHGQLKAGKSIEKHRVHVWCERAEVTPSFYHPVYQHPEGKTKEATALWKSLGLIGKPVIGIAPTSKGRSRSLTLHQTAEIAFKLRDLGFTPVLIHTKHQCSAAINLNPDIALCSAVMDRLDSIIAVDSGTLHVAGARRTPLVGLFGPTDPDMRMTYYTGVAFDVTKLVPCAHCWYKLPCNDEGKPFDLKFACMTRLPLDLVVHKAVQLARPPKLA